MIAYTGRHIYPQEQAGWDSWDYCTIGGHAKVLSVSRQPYKHTLPGVVATPSGPLGEAVKGKLPESFLVARMGDAINELHQEQVVSETSDAAFLRPSHEWP